LHILKLHEDAVPNGNYERFGWQWVLDDSPSSAETQKEENVMVVVVVRPGDVLFIPDLMTGAGEFEAMRFVGKRTEHGWMLLHNGGVEYPEFPQDILLLQPGRSLRVAYAKLLDAMLMEQGGPESLEEIMGGETEVEEYWTQPAMLREKKTVQEQWIIPLEKCTLMKTIP
jgi:hypothetical protein